MQIAVIGATGLTGQEVLHAAKARGIAATAIVRDRWRLSAPAERIIELPDLNQINALERALSEVDCVIVTVGITRKTRSPWAPLVSPPDVCSQVVGTLVEALKAQEAPKRLIYMSTFGASEQWRELPLWIRGLIYTSNVYIGYRDHTAAELKLRNSNLDWTIVRPTALSEGRETEWIEAQSDTSVMSKISRVAVASALLDIYQKRRSSQIISITGASG